MSDQPERMSEKRMCDMEEWMSNHPLGKELCREVRCCWQHDELQTETIGVFNMHEIQQEETIARLEADAAAMRAALGACKELYMCDVSELFTKDALDGTAGKELLAWAKKIILWSQASGRAIPKPPAFLKEPCGG